MSPRSRSVSQGNPLCTTPSRTKAQRRSPAMPCHETSAAASSSPAIDLTGIAPQTHDAADRPAVARATHERPPPLEAPFVIQEPASSVADSIRCSASRRWPCAAGGNATSQRCLADQPRTPPSRPARNVKTPRIPPALLSHHENERHPMGRGARRDAAGRGRADRRHLRLGRPLQLPRASGGDAGLLPALRPGGGPVGVGAGGDADLLPGLPLDRLAGPLPGPGRPRWPSSASSSSSTWR